MGAFRDRLPGLLVAAVLGGAVGAGVVVLVGGDARSLGRDAERALTRQAPADTGRAEVPGPAGSAVAAGDRRRPARAAGAMPAPANPGDVAAGADQQLKDLLTLAWNDRRDMRERIDAFLAGHPGSTGIAVASRGVYDLVDRQDLLSNADLGALYLDQQDPAFKRVLAQAASMRGDSSLVELHVAETAAGLQSTEPAQRQQALVELARTRHVAAADRAAPLLRDADPGVVLDALLALRASGNRRHVAAVQPLLAHPDEPVRWLAREVADDLRTRSDEARTRVARAELAQELPPLPAVDAGTAARCAGAG